MRLGIIGTGVIAEALVIGLSTAPNPPDVIVSPRSEAISTRLAADYANVTRAESNQAVIDASDILLLAVRPTQVEETLAGLSIPARRLVVSLVASLTLDALGKLLPNTRLGRLIPLPMIAHHRGPILLYPAIEELVPLLNPLGTLIVARSESEFATFVGPSAFMSSYFALQAGLIAGLTEKAIAPEAARLYIRSLFEALGQTGLAQADAEAAGLIPDHETPGGLNYNTRRLLTEAGWFDKPSQTFTEVAAIPARSSARVRV